MPRGDIQRSSTINNAFYYKQGKQQMKKSNLFNQRALEKYYHSESLGSPIFHIHVPKEILWILNQIKAIPI
jgi:hypothetical protein